MTNKHKLTLASLMISILAISIFASFNIGILYGSTTSYRQGINDLASLAGIDYSLTRNVDGSYTLMVLGSSTSKAYHVTADLNVAYYQGSTLISMERHAGTLTNVGANWIATKLSGAGNNSQIAKYVSVSADTSAGMSVASTILTNELAANGFTRAVGTYTLTGTGTWTVAKTFTSSGVQTVQLWGLNWAGGSLEGSTLLCYDTSAAKNTVDTDTVAATWSLSVS